VTGSEESTNRLTAPYQFELGYPTDESTSRAIEDAVFERAVSAYRFWYPTVSVEGIFNGNREVGLQDNVSVGRAATGPRQVGFTLNSDTPYAAGALDLSEGPMVVDLPAGPYIGLIDDHHQRWVLDMGIPGPDEGKGGKHLILPPDYDGAVPDGYFVGRSSSFKVLLALRALPVGGDIDRAMESLGAVKIYPLVCADNPMPLDIVDTTTRRLDSTCLRWEDGMDFWQILHGIIDAEPIVDEFRPMYGLLAAVGIEKGKPFEPDQVRADILVRAARTARQQMLASAFASDRADRMAWPDRQWEWASLVPGSANFETATSLDLEARDRWFIQAIVASPAMFRRKVGTGSLYWLGVRDSAQNYLDGGKSYMLAVPQPVPASLFWSITVYDTETRSQIQTEQDNAALRSLFELQGIDPTGPAVLHFGPMAPTAESAPWIRTTPGRGWFAYIRIYGPEEEAFGGDWRPGDFVLT
jgi:hypothetical protein